MLVRKAEPEQQKWLDQDEHHTRHATKRREGIFFEDGKRQEIERDEKGGHGENRLVYGLLIGTGGGELDQGSIGECQHEQREDHAAAGKVPAKDEPKGEDDIRHSGDRLVQPQGVSLGAEKSNRCEKNQPSREENSEEGFPEQIQHGSYLCIKWCGASNLVPDPYQLVPA